MQARSCCTHHVAAPGTVLLTWPRDMASCKCHKPRHARYQPPGISAGIVGDSVLLLKHGHAGIFAVALQV